MHMSLEADFILFLQWSAHLVKYSRVSDVQTRNCKVNGCGSESEETKSCNPNISIRLRSQIGSPRHTMKVLT
jgi:hypothetical protein